MPANREDELRRLYEAGTQSKWVADFAYIATEKPAYRFIGDMDIEEDAALIVAAHNALPRLLAVVAAARAYNAAYCGPHPLLLKELDAALTALDGEGER